MGGRGGKKLTHFQFTNHQLNTFDLGQHSCEPSALLTGATHLPLTE